MIKKLLQILLMANSLAPYASAKVPYSEIEDLRRKTIAIRFASDNPTAKKIKACKISLDFAKMGAKLSLLQDSSAKQWLDLTISTDDLHELDNKSKKCLARASCQIYEVFLSSARVEPNIQPEIEILKGVITKKVETMTSKTYEKAWDQMPKACEILKQTLK